MHSPWGLIEQICSDKGWTMHYVMEKISWANLQMMMADKVQFVKRSEIVTKVSKEELKERRKQMQNG